VLKAKYDRQNATSKKRKKGNEQNMINEQNMRQQKRKNSLLRVQINFHEPLNHSTSLNDKNA